MTVLTEVEVAGQLAAELHARAYPLAVLDGPEAVAALDCDRVARRVAAEMVAALDGEDDRLLAQLVTDVMCALWPVEDPPAEWWRSAVGWVCAHSTGATDRTDTVTHSVAAGMLGVARSTIGVLVSRGHLERGDDGGVTVASVKARMVARPVTVVDTIPDDADHLLGTLTDPKHSRPPN